MFELLIGLIIAVPLVFYAREFHRGWRFLDPVNTFWPLYLLFGVFQACVFRQDWLDVYGESVLSWTLALYVLAGLGVWFGYSRPLGRSLGRGLPLISGSDNPFRYVALGFAALACGLLAYDYVIGASGGLQNYLAVSRMVVDKDISNYIVGLETLVPFGLMVLLCTTSSSPRFRVLRLFSVSATGLFTLWCIYSGTRSGVITVACFVLGSAYGLRRSNPPLRVLLPSAAVVVVLVGFVSSYRGNMYGGEFHSNDSSGESLNRSLSAYTKADQGGAPLGSEFGMSLAAVRFVPEVVPYDQGHMLLELFTAGIPRTWWPDKIYPAGESWDRFHQAAGTARCVNAAGYLTGPAPGLIGKYYYIAGPLGVVLGSIWTGLFLRILKTYADRYTGVTGVVLSVSVWLLGFSEMNNPLAWPIAWIPSIGVFAFLVIVIARKGIPWLQIHRASRRPAPAWAVPRARP